MEVGTDSELVNSFFPGKLMHEVVLKKMLPKITAAVCHAPVLD